MNSRSLLIISSAVSLLLAGCAPGHHYTDIEHEIAKNGKYWQRTSASSAIWMQGPKAQQVLNRDISRCVTELSELERLGQIKSVFPAESKDTKTTDDQSRKNLMGWDAPERDGALLVEKSQYMDFETCMKAKGWERVMYVPYDTGARAGSNFVNNNAILKEQKKKREEKEKADLVKPPRTYNN